MRRLTTSNMSAIRVRLRILWTTTPRSKNAMPEFGYTFLASKSSNSAYMQLRNGIRNRRLYLLLVLSLVRTLA